MNKMLEYVKAHYATRTNKSLAEDLGTTVNSIKHMARHLGLRKTAAHITQVHSNPHAKKIPPTYTRTLSGGYICQIGNVTRHRMEVFY